MVTREDLTGAAQALDALEGFWGEEDLPIPQSLAQDVESEIWHLKAGVDKS